MKAVSARRSQTQEKLLREVRVADTFWERFRGLMFKGSLPGDGLLIRPCRSIHMFFMRFPIDAVFLDKHNRVVAIEPALRPWTVSAYHRKAGSVLELPAGSAAGLGLETGERLDFIRVDESD